MPLVAYSLGAYLAGLLAGFQGSLILIFAAIVGAILHSFRRHKVPPPE